MREIPLSQGKFALVDDEWYERLSKVKWYAMRRGNTYYAVRSVKRGLKWTLELMHRVILGLPDGVEGDHINGDGLDNRCSNLRPATHAENLRNRKPNSGKSHKGFCWNKHARAWQAGIMVDGRQIHLGLFDNEEDAARAYDDAARKYFGAFAKTNGV